MKIAKRTTIFLPVSLLTFVLGVLVTPVVETPLLVLKVSPWELLLRFENADLQALDKQSTRLVEGLVQALTGDRYEEDHPGEFQPALFRRMSNTKGEKRYVLVELAPLRTIPGNSTLRIHVFDTTGRVLSAQEFNAGYRTWVTSMRIRENGLIKEPVLIVDAAYGLAGHPGTQFYALSGDSMALIYMKLDGQLDRNRYNTPHMTIGPTVERSEDEWEKALASADPVEILSALVWFNGNHSTSEIGHQVKARLEELSQSENYWIKTTAQAILENNK